MLIVKDASVAGGFLSSTAESLSHTVVATVDNADEALRIADSAAIDLCLMDMGINGAPDGIETARLLRGKYDIPSLFISSCKDRGTISDAIQTDPLAYLLKPVADEEVVAALMIARMQLRQCHTESRDVFTAGSLIYDIKNTAMTKNGKPIHLAPNISRCLHYLMESIDSQVSTEALIKEIWNKEQNESYLYAFRALIFRIQQRFPELDIKNIRSFGYMLQS